MSTVYDFRHHRTIKNVNPQAAGQELERIRAEKGVLIPADVVEAAVDPESPLHSAFEWDDGKAAHHHRLAQARHLIVSLRVLNAPTAKPMIAFVSVRTTEAGRNYVPTASAMTDEQLRYRVLDEVRQSIEAIERRYSHFAEVAELLNRLKQQIA